MSLPSMRLEVLLPFEVFADEGDVTRIVAETPGGSFGLLAHRLDCVAALAAGILVYETAAHGEAFLAVDEGILVKRGLEVLVSVRRAFRGSDLGQLRQAIAQQFIQEDAQAQSLRSAMAAVESGFLRRFARFQNG